MPPHVLCGLRGPPSWAWQECNRLLRLGRPWGAVTLSRWCVSGDRGRCRARRGLKPKFYQSTQTMVTAGIFPFKENSHGRAGNRTRHLMISSQGLWPLDHEAGRYILLLCGVIILLCFLTNSEERRRQILVTKDSRNVARSRFTLGFQAGGFSPATLPGIWMGSFRAECFVARCLVVFCDFQESKVKREPTVVPEVMNPTNI